MRMVVRFSPAGFGYAHVCVLRSFSGHSFVQFVNGVLNHHKVKRTFH